MFIKKLLVLMSFLLATFMFLAGCERAASGKVIEMNVNNFAPSTHHYAYNVYEPWKKLVEEKTNGRIKVNLYHGGTLGQSKTVLQDVGGGVYDVGVVITSYYYDTKLFPYSIGSLPFAFPNAQVASSVLTKFGEKYAKDAFKDVVYLSGVSSTDAYDFFSTKPIRKFEDIKGLKVRVQGKGDSDMIKAWGAVPVSISLEQTYESLQKGTLDTAVYTPIGAVGNKYYEVGPYITKLGVTVTPLIPIMNKSFYNKLPDDLKKLFDQELGPKLAKLSTESYMKELDKSYAELEKQVKGKGEVITLSPEEMEKFKQPTKVQWERWFNDAKAKGYPAEEMMNDFKKMLEAEGLKAPY